jgi:hypothetical protein
MFSFIRSHRSALVCLAGLACLALLLLLAVVGLFLAASPAAAQNPTPAGPNSDPTYQSLRNVTLSGESVDVSNFNFDLKRDAATTFHLRSGTICFASRVQGRAVINYYDDVLTLN